MFIKPSIHVKIHCIHVKGCCIFYEDVNKFMFVIYTVVHKLEESLLVLQTKVINGNLA